MDAQTLLDTLLAKLHERQSYCPLCGGECACSNNCLLREVWFTGQPEEMPLFTPRDLTCPRCHAEFADPDPSKEYPAGIFCPVCRERNPGGLVGVIHPRRSR